LQATALLNQANIIRLLDELVASLQAMRVDIAGDDPAGLNQCLENARHGREEWWNQRLSDRWPEDEAPSVKAPTSAEIFGQLIGLRKRQQKDNK
jgi:hypothetical protein